MEKADQMLHHRAKDPESLKGSITPYGVVFLNLVHHEHLIKPEWDKIMKYSGKPKENKVKKP